jgi:hypothetical protein
MKQRHRVSRFVALGFSTALLAACGGGDDPAGTANAPAGANPPARSNPPAGNNGPSTAGTRNSAPTIIGAPITSVLQGTAYSFAPSGTDTDGNSLTFSVANLPPWATFDSSTGRLSGTPSAANVGTYTDVTISVSDGSATASLAAFSIQVVAVDANSVTLSWMPPTVNTDGSPLNNLAGYRVYWGTSQGNLSNSVTLPNPGIATYFVDELAPAQWYFAVTAYTTTGDESDYSNLFSKTIR